MKPIKLFYHGPNKNKRNFGDALSPIILRAETGRDVVYASIMDCEMIAIGSILDTFYRWRAVRNLLRNRQPVRVWGSGFIKAGRNRSSQGLVVHAVRGPMTRDRLALRSETPLGDPGLLVEGLVAKSVRPEHAWGLIPHMADINDPMISRLIAGTRNAVLVRLDDEPVEVLKLIAGCERIVSTSLHGLIAADALGIPNWWLRVGDRLIGGDWKFHDYFASIGRRHEMPITLPQDGNLDSIATPFDSVHLDCIPAVCRSLRAALANGLK
jgi:pyruvyltransferase